MTTNGEWLFSKPFEEQVAWMDEEHHDGTLDGDTDALEAKIAELTAENEKLHEELGAAVASKLRVMEERERYRKKFSKALGYADDIRALMDEGLA